MKKHLLALLSWSMLFLGTASFVSCDDDDDDQKTELSASSTYNKYKDLKEAKVEGNDVIYAMHMEGETQVMVLTFSGDKVTEGKGYVDCKTEEAAKAALEAAKAEGVDAELDGTILVTKMSKEDLEDYEGLNKEALVAFLNVMGNGGLEDAFEDILGGDWEFED